MTKQQGVSLISLMIGLLVSMIVVLGMVTIFRNTIQAVVPASEAARSDSERISGLLSAHMMLHDAGFGIDSASYGAHLLVWESASLADGTLNGNPINLGADEQGNAIAWSKQVEGDYLCEGLFADGKGGLLRISSESKSCDNVSSGITGTETPLILPPQHSGDAVEAITITVEEDECRPLGIGTGIDGNVTVTLMVENSTITSTTCIANL